MAEIGATATFARYAASAALDDVPDAVLHEATRTFVNFIGCALGGSRHPAVETAVRALIAYSGKVQASVIGRGIQADILHASLFNCMSSAVLSFDDTHAEAVIHPGGPVCAALLALAERAPVSGKDFVLALMLGVEAACRLSKAVSVAPARGNVIWLQTGIAGGIGAAVAAAKLLGLDEKQMAWAIGIALSEAAGMRSVGGMGFSLVAGHAAQTGLRAALLAQQGFTAADDAIEAQRGFAKAHSPEPNIVAMTDGLGEKFEILSNTYKPYPCGIVIHPSIDCCFALQADGLDYAAIEQLRLKVSSGAVAMTNNRHPKSKLNVQTSHHHWVAAALIYGTATLRDGDRVDEPAIVALRERIDLEVDSAMAADAVEAIVTLKDGRVLHKAIAHCVGSASRPMDDRQLGEKFLSQAQTRLSAAAAAELLQSCWKLIDLDDVGIIGRAAAGEK